MEDEPVLAMLLSQILRQMGHTISAAVDTQVAAIAAAGRCRPDMMLIDEHLREGSGMAALDVIQAGGFVPHIFMTGDDAGLRALRPNAIILRKPFEDTELVEAMKRALDRGAMDAATPSTV